MQWRQHDIAQLGKVKTPKLAPTDGSDKHHDVMECDVMTIYIAAVHGVNSICLLLLNDAEGVGRGEGGRHIIALQASSSMRPWAARYNTWLLIKLTPKGVVFSFLFFPV